jgi:dipeptide/tripeptide permease
LQQSRSATAFSCRACRARSRLLYAADDPRGQSAFSVYYVGINLGAVLAPLVCGTLGELYGWHYGFAAAGIGMCLGLVVYTWGGRYLPLEPAPAGAGSRDAHVQTTTPSHAVSACCLA